MRLSILDSVSRQNLRDGATSGTKKMDEKEKQKKPQSAIFFLSAIRIDLIVFYDFQGKKNERKCTAEQKRKKFFITNERN